MTRREMIQRLVTGATGSLLVWTFPALAAEGEDPRDRPLYAYAVDTTRCIGCCACMRACRAENDVPDGCFRTWIERYRVRANGEVLVDVAAGDDHVFEEDPVPDTVKAFFVPKLCNHCEKSVCSQVCPVGATYETPEGVVLVDQKRCIGCGYCVQACPYGTRFIHPTKHYADKCTLCYHRISRGELPACVLACPKGVRIFGDLHDPESRLSTMLKQRRYRVLKPEMGTHPKCYYLDLDFEVV
ncbi:MAG: 4Fe-4S dicluster domain-containing protein [Lentisphaerae bacterium]|nr:4Fe-4S dicluster domain-containing protein [Lentisphaerota bacterium]